MSNTSLLGSFGGQGDSSLMFRNRIINGDARIAQRGVSMVATEGSSSIYGGPDRFVCIVSGAGGQCTQSQSSITFEGQTKKTIRQTCNTPPTALDAGKFWFGIHQKVEGFNVEDLQGKPFTVSFIFNSNVSGTFSFAIRDKDVTDSYVSTFTAVANTPKRVEISIPAGGATVQFDGGNTTGLDVTVGFLNTGNFQTATLNQWQNAHKISASGATNWASSANNFIELTELQLEAGPTATPFERRPIGQELALAQRYYERLGGPGGDAYKFICSSVDSSTTSSSFVIPYKVEKRIANVTFTYGGSFGFIAGAGTFSAFFIQGDGRSTSQFAGSIGGTGFTAGAARFTRTNNDANAFLAFDAEL